MSKTQEALEATEMALFNELTKIHDIDLLNAMLKRVKRMPNEQTPIGTTLRLSTVSATMSMKSRLGDTCDFLQYSIFGGKCMVQFGDGKRCQISPAHLEVIP